MENKSGRVGVFTRIYRNDETMHQSIESVLNQTYKNLKFYIMVNDVTKKTVSRWQEKDNRIEMINGGINDGFRTCAKRIASENIYVTTIDADDWYDENYLKYLVDEIEEKKVDLVACGNYFFSGENHIVGERKQIALSWYTQKTPLVLPYIYAHFRTIWGKLIKSEVVINADFEVLPDSTKYGGYGGDTLFMFNLLLYANRAAISDKTLYFYRMSEGSGTHSLNPGRLDADEIVFTFVENILRKMGAFEESQRRFLFWIYANALIDTTKLLLKAELSDRERAEKILYIFQKSLTKEMFHRENGGLLEIPELGKCKKYAPYIHQLIFSNSEGWELQSHTEKYYFQIFKIIWPELEEVLTETEFSIIAKNKETLDLFVKKEFGVLTETLLRLFNVFSKDEKRSILKIIKNITPKLIIVNVLDDINFVENYTELLVFINKEEYDEAFELFRIYFSNEVLPIAAKQLVEFWVNLTICLENAPEYVLAKQFQIEVLGRIGEVLRAEEEYKSLLQLGVNDQNMIMLNEYFGFE